MKKQHMVKCSCDECKGTGTVTCPECDGIGSGEYPISSMTVWGDHPNREELMLLKEDAKRVERQYEGLCRLKPERQESYDRQRDSVLSEIASQINDLYKGED